MAVTAFVGCGLSPDELADRGAVKLRQGDIDEAMDDLTAAIEKDPNCVDAYIWRGKAYQYLKEYDKAMQDLDDAVRVGPNVPGVHLARAWLLAGSPDDSMRDGKRAFQDIEQATRVANTTLEEYPELVAAAYAAMGDFPSAIRWQQRFISGGSALYTADPAEILARYRAGKPYRLNYWKLEE